MMKTMKQILVLLLISMIFDKGTTRSCCEDNPTVQIQSGSVQGFKGSYNGFDYSAFLGIPYGQVPTRFRRADPPTPWSGVFQANQIPNNCWQVPFGFPVPDAANSEDCLGIDVYVPKCTGCWGNKKLPVMALIHASAYVYVNGATYPADYILSETQDVIIVSFNYRLGIWGWIYTGDDAVDNNNGLWDVQMALDWVVDNIEAFGGDQNRITLNGYASGGSFAQTLPLADRNRGKFQGTILTDMGTGSAQHIYTSCRLQNELIERVERIAAAVECPTSDHYAMVACLQTVDNQALLQANTDPEIVQRPTEHVWALVPDEELYPDVFYRNYLERKAEGVNLLAFSSWSSIELFFCENGYAPFNSWEENFLNYYKDVMFGNYEEVFYDTVDKYNTHPNDSICDPYVAWVRESDKDFHAPLELSMEYQSKYTHDDTKIYHVKHKHSPSYRGPVPEGYHGDILDIVLVGYGIIGKYQSIYGVSDEEVELGRRMTRMQYNFARTGDPNIGQDVGFEVPEWRHNRRMTVVPTIPLDDTYIAENIVGKKRARRWQRHAYRKDKLGPGGCTFP